ncbi:hypothetical protein E5K00_10325 [Hymenobacter aquaticus]|uniref:SH3 domain-containing protein n=1 Tax=Hymenobacter aquaticus TaxID=1867101 RepID=A0A4Z0Q645_9BACT|nr:hypothetical protein [Hymenobacter aquaticus]TGE25557.1 hypothetical protein E5K00_10325 [Hymenobacter aquaticus]
MKTILTLLFGLYLLPARAADLYANTAIIRDLDGYTNVRATPTRQGQILLRLRENQVFFFDPEEYEQHQEWITVWVAPDRFNTQPVGDAADASYHTQGYVHRSRLQTLLSLPAYRGPEFRIRYELVPFRAAAHTVDRSQGWVEIKDVPYAWGVDGHMPRTEIRAVRATVQGQAVPVPRRLLAGLFEAPQPTDVFRRGNTFFVVQQNGDGAGGYTLVWVFTKAGLQQRLVGNFT